MQLCREQMKLAKYISHQILKAKIKSLQKKIVILN